jgi:hypothetical protein
MQERFSIELDAVDRSHRVDADCGACALQRPRRVMDVHSVRATAVAAFVQAVAFRQEIFERALRGGEGRADWLIGRLEARGFIVVADARVFHHPTGRPDRHGGGMVGQAQERARRGGGDAAAGIEAEETDAGLVLDAHVGADVQFGKLRHPRQRRHAAWGDVGHAERHDANPRFAVEFVEGECRGNLRAQQVGRYAPVRKQQVVPRLRHHPGAVRHRPGPVRDLVQDSGAEIVIHPS